MSSLILQQLSLCWDRTNGLLLGVQCAVWWVLAVLVGPGTQRSKCRVPGALLNHVFLALLISVGELRLIWMCASKICIFLARGVVIKSFCSIWTGKCSCHLRKITFFLKVQGFLCFCLVTKLHANVAFVYSIEEWMFPVYCTSCYDYKATQI